VANLSQCEFFLIRYVPDVVKDEFVNIGLVVRSPHGIEIRFTSDFSRLKCMDPGVDTQWIRSYETDLRALLCTEGETNTQQFKKMEESFSNTVQFSPVKGLYTQDVAAEADKLQHIYLDTSRSLKAVRERRESNRQLIYAKMADAFEQAGVWGPMWKGIAAASFIHPGDPFKVDCGYRYVNGVSGIKMFHAIAVETGTEVAKALGYTWPEMRTGILRKDNEPATLTAIVNDGLDELDDRISCSLSIFKREGIAVATLSEMPKIADKARLELRE